MTRRPRSIHRLFPISFIHKHALPLCSTLLALLITFHFLPPISASAATINWTYTGVGATFNTSSFWNSGAGPVPGAADNAQFDVGNTVAINIDPTTLGLTINAPVAFSGTTPTRTYTVTGNGTSVGSGTVISSSLILLGSAAIPAQHIILDTASLNIHGGGSLSVQIHNDVSTGTFNLGTSGGGTATATIDGSGSSFVATGSTNFGQNNTVGTLVFQNSATGSFAGITTTSSGFAASGANITIQSGADLTATGDLDLGVGTLAGQVSTFTVTGSGSSVIMGGASTLTLGAAANSSSSLTIASTASFTTGTGAITINPTGTLSINGTFNANADITVDGGTLQRTSTSGFNLANAKDLTAQNGGQVNFTGGYILGSASIFNILSGSSFSASTFFNVGELSAGTLLVDNSTFSCAGDPTWGFGATGSVTFRNNSAATVSSTLSVGSSSVIGTVGILNVQSGATLDVASSMVIGNGSTGTGTVTVSGGGITQAGSSTLAVGAVSGGIGTLTLSGGSFTTGTGLTTINNTGLINITTGNFSPNGNITVAGGELRRSGTSALTWAPSKTMAVQGAGQVNITSSYSLPANAIVNVSGAGSQFNQLTTGILTVTDGSQLNLTTGGTASAIGLSVGTTAAGGTILVDGGGVGGSTLTATGTTNTGLSGGLGTITFQNNAAGAFAALSLTTSAVINSASHFTVQSGSDVTASANVSVGSGSQVGQVSTLLVTGSGSTFIQSGASTLTIGGTLNSTSSLTVSSSGVFTTGTGLTTVNPTGLLDIATGTFNANGNITINGGTLQRGGNGAFTWATAKTMAVQNSGLVTFTGTYSLPANAIVNVSGADSLFQSSSTLTINDGSQLNLNSGGSASATGLSVGTSIGGGTLTVDGGGVGGSNLTVTGSISMGLNGGLATLTFQNNATGNFGFLGLTSSASANSTSHFTVQSGSVVTSSGGVNIGLGTLASQSSTLTVSGPGSSFVQTGTVPLTIGATANSTSTLTVSASGTFTTATGVTTVNPTGLLSISGGTFIANGTLLVKAGGALTIAGTTDNWSGTLDLTSSKLILPSSSPADKTAKIVVLNNQITSGANGLLWNGNGITSSSVALDPNHYAVGLFDNAILNLATFGGQPADTSSILLAISHLGDANRNGIVDIQDLTIVANNWQQSRNNWAAGDLNRTGLVDIQDLTIVANNWQQTSAFPLQPSSPLTPSPTPEPASLIFLTLSIPLLVKRRHKTSPTPASTFGADVK